MFAGDAIGDLITHLEGREASLWHACQLTDFLAYLALGGIPSRSLIERSRLSFTSFVTDSTDRAKGVWDKVFCNLDDFGRSFAAGRKAVPNPYGPIVFQIAPRALVDATDVAVTLRSAGAHDFDRAAESLSDVSEVDRVYRFPALVGFPLSAETRSGEELAEAFPGTQFEAKSAELSISYRRELLALEHVSMVCAEPIEVGGLSLAAVVADLTERLDHPLTVRERAMGERADVWEDITTLLADGPLPLSLVADRADIGVATRRWFGQVRERRLDWQYERFVAYLDEGTLRPLRHATSIPPLQPESDSVPEWTELPGP